VADDTAVGAAGGDQPVAVLVVDVGGPADGAVEVGKPQKNRRVIDSGDRRSKKAWTAGPGRDVKVE
jgi:hypothetical protein